MAKCNRCGDEIEWLKSKTGKSHPVNPTAVIIQGERGNTEAYRSHFTTCSASQKSEQNNFGTNQSGPPPNAPLPDSEPGWP